MSKAKWTVLGTIGALALVGVGLVAANAGPFGAGAAQQPIAFPHDLHAGRNQIPCLYCHSSADRSVDAGMPSVGACAGCHLPGGVPLVRADRPEVKKLVSYWERKEPIPWVRVYDLPDHVHFPHMRHVNAGLACQTCHGPVETMPAPQVTKAASLRMGWCIDCHRTRGARTDCFVCHY